MKGIIYYYSMTGNTRLACQYLIGRVTGASFDLRDIRQADAADLDSYELCGFACSTDFMRPPRLMDEFIGKLPIQKGKPAFILNTNAGVPGKTMPILTKWLTARGFLVFGGHALFTPESYPPLRAMGRTHEEHPSADELAAFQAFIARLDGQVIGGLTGLAEQDFSVKGLGAMYPPGTGPKFHAMISKRRLQAARCNECGLCQKECPHQAITLDPKPVFDMKKCQGCWACYNRCPQQAVYVWPWRRSQYSRPGDEYRRKMNITEV